MSALGQKQTFAVQKSMSALLLKADMCSANAACLLCAKSGLMHRSKYQPLFDHLVGAGEERRRHGEAERFGGLHIDRQLKFGRCLHRQVCGLGAPEGCCRYRRRLGEAFLRG